MRIVSVGKENVFVFRQQKSDSMNIGYVTHQEKRTERETIERARARDDSKDATQSVLTSQISCAAQQNSTSTGKGQTGCAGASDAGSDHPADCCSCC